MSTSNENEQGLRSVDLETAQTARGLRLVLAAGIPSPWSEAAKGIFRTKNVPGVIVRVAPTDKEVRKWTRSRNAPAVMYDDEPARTGWSDILELSERIGPEVPLVPEDARDRMHMFGLSHEVMGEGGVLWSGRLLTIAEGLDTDGERGFPPFAGNYLAARYGFSRDRLAVAKVRVAEGLSLLEDALGDRAYFFGDRLSALDIYSASAMNIFAPYPEDRCSFMAPIRHAFESMKDHMAQPSAALLAHRDRMYERHLELPIVC